MIESVEKGKGGAHFAPLDGVRGIAIVVVMLFHFFPWTPGLTRSSGIVASIASGGWMGVGLFFVLSGYLITGILVETKGSSNYFKSFYARRALRIFPAYYSFLILVGFVIGPLLAWNFSRVHPGMPSDPAQNLAIFRAYQGYYWLYLTNILIALKGFAVTALWMTPFWSLAVEEQFYLVWPLVVKLSSAKRLVIIALIGAVTATVFRAAVHSFQWFDDPAVAVAMLTPSWMDTLAAGALLAILSRNQKNRDSIRRYSVIGGVVSIVALIVIFIAKGGIPEMDAMVQLTAFPASAVGGAALIGRSITTPATGMLNRALAFEPLRSVGFYSYGIYILHMPTFWLTNRLRDALPAPLAGFSNTAVAVLWFLLAGVLAWAAAWVMWHLIEQHFLALKKYFPSHKSSRTLVPGVDQTAVCRS